MKKRWARLVVILLSAIVSILFLAFLLLLTPPAKNLAFNELRHYLHSRSGIELQASKFRIDFFRGEIDLENPVIRSASEPDLPPVFKAKRTYIKIGLFKALKKNWIVEELSLTAPQIHYFTGQDGHTNLPAFSSVSGRSSDFLVLKAKADDGSFQYQDLQRDVSVMIPQWQLSVNGNQTTLAHDIIFTGTRDSSLEYKSFAIPINSLEFAGTLKDGELQINLFQIEAADSRLSARGSLDNLSSPTMDIVFMPEIDLGSVASIVNLKEIVRGNLTGEIRTRGGPGNTHIEAQIKGTNISARDYVSTNLDLKTQTEWNPDSGKLTVHSFDLISPEGSISAEAELFTVPADEPHTIEASIRDLNLLPIWRQLNAPFDLASRSSGRVSVQWQGAFFPSKITGKVHLNLAAARKAPDLNLLPVSGILDAQIRPNRILGDLRSLAVLGTEVNGKFDLKSFQDIEGDFQGDAPNIENLMGQLSQFLGMPDYLVGANMEGPIRLNVQASGRLKHPRIVAAVSAPTLQLGELKNLRASAEATLLGSQINFSNTIRLPQDSVFSIKGDLELGGPQTLMNLDLHTDGMPIDAFRSIFNSDIQALGNLKTSMHVDGTMDNLNGFGSIMVEDLSLYGEPLGLLNMDLRLTGNEIQSSQFKLERNPENSETDYLEAWFLYSLDSEQFQFRAEGKDLTLDQLKLPRIGTISGSMNLTASGEGTTQQQSVDLRLESSNVQVRNHPIGSLSVNGTLRNGEIKIDTAAPDIGLSSVAVVATHDPFPFSGELQVEKFDLSRLGLEGLEGQPLSGIIEGGIAGSGNIKDLARTRLSAHIQRLHVQTGELEIHIRDPLQMEYGDNSFAMISPASIVSGNSLLEITGGLAMRKSAPADTLYLKGQIDLGQVTGIIPVPIGYKAAGILDLNLSMTGAPQDLSSSGTMSLNDGVIEIPKIKAPLTDVTLRANIQDGSLIVQQANAAWAQGRIGLTGELPFGLLLGKLPLTIRAKEGPARFVLDMENLRPEATGMLPDEIKGLISFNAAGEISGTDLRSLRAQIDFRDLDLQYENIAFKLIEPSSILVQDGTALVSRLSLAGPQTNIEVSGSAGFYPEDPLNLKLAGDLDSALFTAATQNVKTAGSMKINAEIGGSRNAPTLTGYAEMNGGRVSVRNPRIMADSLTARMDFTADRISIREISGTLNGGSIDLDGTIGYQHGVLNDFDLKAELQDFFLNYPEGLKTASSGTLTVKSSEDSIVIGGNIQVLESSYREPFGVGGQLMSYLRSQQVLEIGKKRDPLLERIRLDIAVQSTTPLLVQNNIARLEADANLRLVGTYYEPSITGRIDLNEGGEIILNQQPYYINRGVITLADQTHIEPDLNIRAQTKAGNYDITLQLAGTPDRLTTTLSSEPALSEPDILSLLLTGRTVSEMQGRETQMVQTQALSLIAGQAGEEVAREARQLLGLSTLRIDPGLIASESDPGARLTLGQDITRDFNLAYSMNLVNGGDQIWIAQYDVGNRFTTQATRQEDNTYRFDVRHDLRFGSPSGERPSRSTAQKFEIGSIQIHGREPFSEKDLLEKLKLKTGDKYDFQKIQKGMDRLQNFYTDQKRLEAEMRMRRETQQSTVNLNLNIDAGPVVEFRFNGTNIPGNVKKQVTKAWEEGVFEAERIDDAILAIRRPLIRSGFLQSEVTSEVKPGDDQKLVHFQIDPGKRFSNVPIKFPGASEISEAELGKVLGLANLRTDVYADPEKLVDYLESYYRENGYLQAKVELPQLQLDPVKRSGQASIRIQEGPLFLIGDLEFNGNQAFDYDQLWSVIPTSTGSSYDPNTLRDAVKALENLYHSNGYNDVTITFRVVQDSEAPRAHLTFQITERRQSIIRDIAIEGNLRTSPTFVERQLDFKVGDALDFRKIDITRKRLYDTGVYTSVDFQTEEIAESIGPEKDVRINVKLREIQPYRLQYGIYYDTDRGPGGILEARYTNLLGSASTLGLRLRYDSDLQDYRVFFNQPFVRKIHTKLNASAFIQRENRAAYDSRRIGFSIFREQNLAREFRFEYGYRFDRVRWTEEEGEEGDLLDPTLFQTEEPVGRAVFTLARDTRDSFLDATRGEFQSHSLELGPSFLGSETGFARYHGQYFRYVPLDRFLGRPQRDAEGKRIPPKIFYAGALRIGLTRAFSGDPLISPSRFFAGGGTTMRGFEQDMLGPIDDRTGRPKGGEALFLFNNEIRFPIISVFQGVAFMDLGGVTESLSDPVFRLRKSAGIGLRIKVKYVPIRFDYGWKLDSREPGESAGAFFFSIGQAF